MFDLNYAMMVTCAPCDSLDSGCKELGVRIVGGWSLRGSMGVMCEMDHIIHAAPSVLAVPQQHAHGRWNQYRAGFKVHRIV